MRILGSHRLEIKISLFDLFVFFVFAHFGFHVLSFTARGFSSIFHFLMGWDKDPEI